MVDFEDGLSVVPFHHGRPKGGLKLSADTVQLQPIVDSDEHGQVVSVRLPDDLLAAHSRLREHEGWPYETRADFIRDAFYMAIEAISTKLGTSDHDVQNAVTTKGLEKLTGFWARERERVRTQIYHIEYQLRSAQDVEDLTETHRILIAYWRHVQGLPLEFWQRQYQQGFQTSAAVRASAQALRLNGYRLPPELVQAIWTETSPT